MTATTATLARSTLPKVVVQRASTSPRMPQARAMPVTATAGERPAGDDGESGGEEPGVEGLVRGGAVG